jgi:zinc transport system substrate-binding protein
MSSKIAIYFFLLGILLISSYLFLTRVSSTSQKDGKIHVSTSFYPLYFFASQIGQDKAIVINITPSGAEPHDYEPTAQDIAKIERSDLLILNGGVEAWAEKIKDTIKGKKTKVVIAGEGLLTQNITENGQVTLDSHIWLSPSLAKQEVEKIANKFTEIDPK